MCSESPSTSQLRRRWWRRIYSLAVAFAIGITVSLLIIRIYAADQGSAELINPVISDQNTILMNTRKKTTPARKLLNKRGEEEAVVMAKPSRIWSERCSKSDIMISQGATSPLPNGIPTYTVEIMNVCMAGCDISAIHLTCGWFSSARIINPRIFKRLQFNDCLVNNGNPLRYGRTLSFQYSNTFRYPLSVSSFKC